MSSLTCLRSSSCRAVCLCLRSNSPAQPTPSEEQQLLTARTLHESEEQQLHKHLALIQAATAARAACPIRGAAAV